ncbi:sigma-70 family RNA polymerase sigma factor [bacterium]|nr:sigma-70 family RNA polymerase sigma factor [bacterium]
MCALALWYEIFQHIGRSFNTLSIWKPPWATSKEAFIFLIEGERTQPRCRSPPPAFMYSNPKSGNRKENDMNAEMKNYVIKLLETYHDRERKIAVLRYDLEHPSEVGVTEQIEAMNYGSGEGVGHSKGHISNKTLYIALNYEEQAKQLNAESAKEIADELFILERRQKKLLYYISLLEKRQAEVVRMVYMEGVSTKKAAEQHGLTVRTIERIRKDAVDNLAEMYAYSERYNG